MRRPQTPTLQSRAFPMAIVSRRPLMHGMEYGETIAHRPIPAPNIRMPVRSSLAQVTNIHRFHISRYFTRLRTYGFRPGNPVLKSVMVKNTNEVRRRGTPLPSISKTPASSRPGYMAPVRRFPKALRANPNTYTPPVYGGQ